MSMPRPTAAAMKARESATPSMSQSRSTYPDSHFQDITKPAPTRRRDSQSNERVSVVNVMTIGSNGPPPYVDPPSYTDTDTNAEEPRTLPMFFFFFGFVCPVLWLVGTCMMRLPHSDRRGIFDPLASWALSAEEQLRVKEESRRRLRKWEVEMKWAKRCMWASVVFICVGLTAGMVTWAVVTNKRGDSKA